MQNGRHSRLQYETGEFEQDFKICSRRCAHIQRLHAGYQSPLIKRVWKWQGLGNAKCPKHEKGHTAFHCMKVAHEIVIHPQACKRNNPGYLPFTE